MHRVVIAWVVLVALFCVGVCTYAHSEFNSAAIGLEILGGIAVLGSAVFIGMAFVLNLLMWAVEGVRDVSSEAKPITIRQHCQVTGGFFLFATVIYMLTVANIVDHYRIVPARQFDPPVVETSEL